MNKTRFRLVPIIIAASCLSIGTAEASEADRGTIGGLDGMEGSFPGGTNPSDLWASFFQIILVLIVIIGLILLFVKLLSKKNRAWFGNRAVRMLGGVQLGQNKSLQLVEIGRAIYVIGVGENVHLVYRIEDESEIKDILDRLQDESSSGNWRDWLNLRRKREMVEDQDALSATDYSFQQIFHDKMKDVSHNKRKIGEWLAEADKDGSDR